MSISKHLANQVYFPSCSARVDASGMHQKHPRASFYANRAIVTAEVNQVCFCLELGK